MGCDIVFKINGELQGAAQQSSKLVFKDSIYTAENISLNKIAEAFFNPKFKDVRIELISRIKNLKNTDNRTVTPNTIIKEGVVGNVKLHSVITKYTGIIPIPNLTTPYNPDILLVKKFKNNEKNRLNIIYGTNAAGNMVYVVEDSEGGVQKLFNHLRVRDLILNKFTDNEELARLKPKIEQSLGKSFTSQQELLLDFIVNKSAYYNMKGVVGVYGLLTEICKNLQYENRSGYHNPLDMEFNSKLDPKKSNLREGTISFKSFLEIVEDFTPELLEGFSKQDLKNPEIVKKIFEQFYENLSEFSGRLIRVADKELVIRRTFNSLEVVEDFTYDTITKQTATVEVYRGIHIYSYKDGEKTWYLYSQDGLSPTSSSSKYSSMEDVKARIDQKYANSGFTFKKNFELGFRVIPSYEQVNSIFITKNHMPRSIVQVLDIELNKDIELNEKEESLIIGDRPLSDFYDLFRRQLTEEQFNRLTKEIDSIEKAGIFVYLVNESLGTTNRDFENNEEAFNDILDRISKAAYKRYYIQSTTFNKKTNQGYAQVIPLSSSPVEVSEKYKRDTPIIGLMMEVVETFKEKFGVDAELLTREEMNDRFKDLPAHTKAFIRDGKIYINGTDATSADIIHEYTHLLLGVLKAQDFDTYARLMKLVVSKSGIKFIEKLRNIYPNLADSDFNEEVFAISFGEFLAGKRPKDIFLQETKEAVDSKVKSIFNLASEEDFNSLYKGRLKNIFQTFSKDIGKLGNGLDFSQGTIYRQAANWISDQIKEGSLKEEC